MSSAVILLVLAAPSAGAPGCTGPECPTTSSHPAVVRIMVAGSAGSRTYGSGTLVDVQDAGNREQGTGNRGIVLTCAHLFDRDSRETTVTFPDGRRFGAILLEADPTWDLAALAIAPPGIAPIAVADAVPQPGQSLTSCGYGRDGRYWCNRGRALGYARTADTYETLQLTGMAREGDSGGPVLDTRGQLVAVLWGTDGRTVVATYCGRVRLFLRRILGRRRGVPIRRPLVPVVPQDQGPAVVVPGSGNSDQAPPVLGDHLDEIRGTVAGLDRRLGEIGGRMDELGRRLEELRAEGRRQTAGGEGQTRHPQIPTSPNPEIPTLNPGTPPSSLPTLPSLLPGLLAALGWTGPPSIAAVFALKLALGLVRRKRRRKRPAFRVQGSGRGSETQSLNPEPRTPNPLNDDYAEQLARVYALSGHSPVADATLGREYDEELRRAEESSDGTLAGWAKKLRQRVARRFYRIHGEAPAPAEPVES